MIKINFASTCILTQVAYFYIELESANESTRSVKNILENLRLGKYYERFVENNINYEAFKALYETNIRKLNLSRYARDKILIEIAMMKKEGTEGIHSYIIAYAHK